MLEIYYYDNGVKKARVEQLPMLKKKQLWIDVQRMTKKESEILKSVFDLHPLTVEDLSKTHTRIKVEEFSHYLFCVFYGVRNDNGLELMELDFILGENFLISNHYYNIKDYEDLKENKEQLAELFRSGNDFIFHYLLDTQVDNYFPVLDEIDVQLDHIEEKVTKSIDPEIVKKILQLKRLILLVKKAALPQREKLSFLQLNGSKRISHKALPYFRDIYDHSIRVCDYIDSHRESVASTFEFYMSAVNNNTNEVMKMLSIVATIVLPLTVISSIYGTNFSNLPGAQFHYGFWVMVLMMFVVSGMMLHYFYKKGWVRIVM